MNRLQRQQLKQEADHMARFYGNETVTLEDLPGLVERERRLKLTDAYWRGLELLNDHREALNIVFKAWVDTRMEAARLDREDEALNVRFSHIIRAIENHYMSEIFRSFGR